MSTIVGLVYSDIMLKHECEEGEHAECPGRLTAIMNQLESDDADLLKRCQAVRAKKATDDELALVHTQKHIELIKKLKYSDRASLRALEEMHNSVYFNRASTDAALFAAGSVLAVAKMVADDKLKSAVAVVRPPGHHAEVTMPMGFCLLNNIAIAAKWILKKQPKWKILIVDWDVHHGNGTQHIFWKEPRALYFSVHRGDKYPFGEELKSNMVGGQGAEGFNVNVPLFGHKYGDADYLAIWEHVLMPIATSFSPDIIIVSGGFDAAEGDPLGQLHVTSGCYYNMMNQLRNLAQGKIIMALEGGYDLPSTAECFCACVGALLDDPPAKLPSSDGNVLSKTWDTILQVCTDLECHWEVLSRERAKIENKCSSTPKKMPGQSSSRDLLEAEDISIIANGQENSSSTRDLVEAEDISIIANGQENSSSARDLVEAEDISIMANGQENSSLARDVVEAQESIIANGQENSSSTKVNSSDHREKRQKRKCKSFKYYLVKVLKKVHPDHTLSAEAVQVMVDFVHDMFDKLASEGSTLMSKRKRKTLTPRDIEHAVQLVLPGELAVAAVSEGRRAIQVSGFKMNK